MRGLLITACLTGCQVVFPLETDPSIVCGGNSTAALTDLCVAATSKDLQLIGAIDTDTDCEQVFPQSDSEHTELCAITGATIDVGTVLVTGSRPLLLVASGDLTVDGTLSVASHPGAKGAGADYMKCARNIDGDMTAGDQGAPGGAGGSFSEIGGNGGNGGSSSPLGAVASFDSTPLVFIRGGCDGGNGGMCVGRPSNGGDGGHSGGAVYIIANGTITVTGTIDASGSGGGGGQRGNPDTGLGSTGGGGGGGAGSGGLIGLDAPMVILEDSGVLLANGGGGGAGGFDSLTGNGADGDTASDGDVNGYPYIADGGFSNGAGDGGLGGTAENSPQPGTDDAAIEAGGGGGGGGAGIIVIAAGVADIRGDTSPDQTE